MILTPFWNCCIPARRAVRSESRRQGAGWEDYSRAEASLVFCAGELKLKNKNKHVLSRQARWSRWRVRAWLGSCHFRLCHQQELPAFRLAVDAEHGLHGSLLQSKHSFDHRAVVLGGLSPPGNLNRSSRVTSIPGSPGKTWVSDSVASFRRKINKWGWGRLTWALFLSSWNAQVSVKGNGNAREDLSCSPLWVPRLSHVFSPKRVCLARIQCLFRALLSSRHSQSPLPLLSPLTALK